MIAYKLVREDFGSLCDEGRVIYGEDWQEVDGNGAYCSATGEGITVGGVGLVMIRLEVEGEVDVDDKPAGVTCWRRVRRVGVVQLPDTWEGAYRAWAVAERALGKAGGESRWAWVKAERAWREAYRAWREAYRACDIICIAAIKEDKK